MARLLWRSHGVNLSALLRENLVGMDLGAVHPELAGRHPREFLPARSLGKVIARHTVGLSDPLTAADVPSGEALADGLPQTLEECVEFYGLRHFKLKVKGDVGADLDRLQQIAAVVTRRCGRDYAFTLDGNEHHYFRGLSVFPPAISEAMLRHHGDLYTRLDHFARVDVRGGELRLGSVNAAPFGIAAELPMDEFEQVSPVTSKPSTGG